MKKEEFLVEELESTTYYFLGWIEVI